MPTQNSWKSFIPHIAAAVCVLTLSFLIFQISFALAADPTGGNNPPSGGNNTVRLANPLKVNSIEAFLVAIIQILVVFATPIIVLFIMYAGYLFVTAQGDTGKLEDAKRALLWSVVGGVIVLGAELIAQVIKGTVTGLQI